MRAWTALGLVLLAMSLAALSAEAQPFNQFISFGDSTIDSGWYRSTPPLSNIPNFDTAFATAVTQGAGKATTSPGQVSSEALAATLGLTAIPVNQPSGSNYATGGARNNAPSDVNGGAVSTLDQIGRYLAGNGGAANPNAVYVISSGGNDIGVAAGLPAAQRNPTVIGAANDLISGIARLRAAGARVFIVPNQPQSQGNDNQRALRTLYNNTLWSGLAAAGINFIPADFDAVLSTVRGNLPAFGFTGTGFACTPPNNISSGWALLCSPTSTVSPFATPDAAQTRLFADNVHLSSGGHKIVADYEYSLLVAPSMISMLAEAPVKTRAAVIGAIENQIPLSQRQRGPTGFNGWVTGDVRNLSINNTPGFPNDPGTPANLIAGVDTQLSGWLVGGAISAGTQLARFDRNFGNFRQNEFAFSGYGATKQGPVRLAMIGTVGAIDYSVNRSVPIGITIQPNSATTSGTNLSFAATTAYDFVMGPVTHGPVGGMTLQRIRVGGFTETGSFTSLSFADQTRYSAASVLGYQADVDLGAWRPFARVVWNHELADINRDVRASLTTTVAPSYTMPAVVTGRDWGSATVGTAVRVSDRINGLIAFAGDFAQRHLSNYGAQLGLNAAF